MLWNHQVILMGEGLAHYANFQCQFILPVSISSNAWVEVEGSTPYIHVSGFEKLRGHFAHFQKFNYNHMHYLETVWNFNSVISQSQSKPKGNHCEPDQAHLPMQKTESH